MGVGHSTRPRHVDPTPPRFPCCCAPPAPPYPSFHQVIFRNVHKLLLDTATSEYLFCCDFFDPDEGGPVFK